MKFWFIMNENTVHSTVTSLTAVIEALHNNANLQAIKCETDATQEEITKEGFYESGNFQKLGTMKRTK